MSEVTVSIKLTAKQAGALYVKTMRLEDEVKKIQAERDALAAQVEQLKKIAKEEAHDAYYEASDNNRCDRWSDTFDEDIKAEFEEYWNKNKIYEKFKIEPVQYLQEIKAQAGRAGFVKATAIDWERYSEDEIKKAADEYAECVKAGE
jgi:hypothetical protein